MCRKDLKWQFNDLTHNRSSLGSGLQHEKSYGQTIIPDTHRRRVTHHDRGNPNLDPGEDLDKNREFYRIQDVRPPYTYAALIRQVSHFQWKR